MKIEKLLEIYTQLTPENQKKFMEYVKKVSEEAQKEREQGNEGQPKNICCPN